MPIQNGKSNSDLTIGDLWGADKITPNFYDTLGVGIVILRSKKGEKMFHTLQLEKIQVSETEAKIITQVSATIYSHTKNVICFSN